MTHPTLAVIILNWNGRAYLEACLAALEGQSPTPDRVILVDNGSTDDSVAFVRARFPWVLIRENGGNVGFAAGNNAALRDETADIIVLLNPDMVLAPGGLAALAGAIAGDPAVGIVGGKLWYPGGEIIQHAGGFITHPQALPGHHGIGEPDEGQYDTPRDVEYLIGAAVAVRRTMLDEIGLMDEGFFLFFEDVDLCARARRAGYRVVYEPGATGIHVESATAGKGSFAYLQRFHTGRWRYLLKHFPPTEIVEQTPAAEAAWLNGLDAAERRAVGLAYLSTLHRLPNILQIREREGAGALSADERVAIEAALVALRERAREGAFDADAMAKLSAAAVLHEQPFTSTVPLIGPLIARLRAAWNDVASRWYLGHLMAQQNAFNTQAVSYLERYEIELREQIALLEEEIVVTTELQERIEGLEARIELLRLQAIGPPETPSGA